MKVTVIGAGPSGLVAAKEILEALPACSLQILESSDRLGGTFAHAYPGLRMVNNPLLVCFSDHLPTDVLPELRMWTAEEYVRYLQGYAERHDLLSRLRFKQRVEDCRPEGPGWRLRVNANGVEREEQTDYLVVCAGSNSEPAHPAWPGQETFRGRILHASELRDLDPFAGQRIVLVGLGETGSDLADLLTRRGAEVAISVRQPGYVIARTLDGRPTDLDTSRLHHALPPLRPDSLPGRVLRCKRWLERRGIRSQTDRRVQELIDRINDEAPASRRFGPLRRASTKSCGVAHAMLRGRATLKPALQRMEPDAVVFEDGSRWQADVVVLCTGYRQTFPFLPDSFRERNGSSIHFHRLIFPPGWDRLAFIGYARPGVGTVPVIAELQARLLAAVLAGRRSLPSATQMATAIDEQLERSRRRFPQDFARIPHLVDYHHYLSLLAADVGALPPAGLVWKDPLLWFKLHCAFLCPAAFRLHGTDTRAEDARALIRRLPTMPWSSLALELIAHAAARWPLGVRRD